MSDARLNYVGPIPAQLTGPKRKTPWWRRIPLAFLVVVVLPTALAVIYYLAIATPRYVSESRFTVRAANQTQPSSLGAALSGVGISTGQSDAYAVHTYVDSRDGMAELGRRFDLERIFGRDGADPFSRYPRPFESDSEEGLFKAFQRFVTIGYDSTTGMSTLRVEAFTPREAQAVNEALLGGGERLINRLNERSSTDAVTEAERAVAEAQTRLSGAQQQLAAFRNRQEFIDPTRAATEASQLIGGLLGTVAALRAERAQLAGEAPNSPQLPLIDGRIRAFENQIAQERARVVGNADSIAPSIGAFEDLTLQRELAGRELTQATEALRLAQQEGRRQRLYLDRVVNPNLPDSAAEPRRWRSILTVLISCLLAYGVGWLVWAGVREHGQ